MCLGSLTVRADYFEVAKGCSGFTELDTFVSNKIFNHRRIDSDCKTKLRSMPNRVLMSKLCY